MERLTTPGTPVTELIKLVNFTNLDEHLRTVHDHAVHFGGKDWGEDISSACYFVIELSRIMKSLKSELEVA